MNALFVERPEFSRDREEFLDDDAFRALQCMMLKMPEAGVVLEGMGGLRKLRYVDPHRSRGKRSGVRVIYYWCDAERQFWLFRLYVKVDVDEAPSAAESCQASNWRGRWARRDDPLRPRRGNHASVRRIIGRRSIR